MLSSSGRLPFIPAYPERKPDQKKWPTSKFAESGTEAADAIAASRKGKKNKKRKNRKEY